MTDSIITVETPRRTVRVPEAEWRAAKAAAALAGETVSDVIRNLLAEYVRGRRQLPAGTPVYVLTQEDPPTAVYPNHIDDNGITWYWGSPGEGPELGLDGKPVS